MKLTKPRLLSFGLILLSTCAVASGATRVEQLRCEYLDNPLGIDTPQPRLSWIITSSERGVKQSAYQILVAGSEAGLKRNQGELWDSGKVTSDDTAQIYYAGLPLASRQQVFWKVRVWDQAGAVSESKPARWEMGLIQQDDWGAKWIARTTATNSNPAPLLRRAFRLDGKIKQARAYICGLGYYELYLWSHFLRH